MRIVISGIPIDVQKKKYKEYAFTGETAGWTCGNFCAFIGRRQGY